MTLEVGLRISFITANFVARQLGYHMTEGWMQGDAATQAYFRPLETFAERFEGMLGEIRGLGFDALDLWGAHLHPSWATPEHLEAARQALKAQGLEVLSLAAWCGSLSDLEGFCRVARAVGAPLIAGGAPVLRQRSEARAILKNYGVKLGVENHPEKTPAELLAQIEDGAGGYIGAACDTGWWATQGYSAPAALRELQDHLLAVHLKDVRAAGAHQTCALGQGVADIEGCVRVLQEMGYSGPLGIEHEPETFDPGPDVLQSKKRLEGWWSSSANPK